MAEVYLGLGGNQGDRNRNIHEALDMIAGLPDTKLLKVSSLLETPAMGFDGADFLNCCCEVATELEPLELLHELKRIERALGRNTAPARYNADGSRLYSDRPIDIDILLYGDEKIHTEELQIPHPRMLERDFVMIPLNEIRNKQIL